MDETPFKWPRWLLPTGDVLLVMAAFLFSYYLRYEMQFLQPVDEANAAPFAPYWPYAIIFAALMLVFNQGARLYRERRGRTWWDEVFAITNGATSAAVIAQAITPARLPNSSSALGFSMRLPPSRLTHEEIHRLATAVGSAVGQVHGADRRVEREVDRSAMTQRGAVGAGGDPTHRRAGRRTRTRAPCRQGRTRA